MNKKKLFAIPYFLLFFLTSDVHAYTNPAQDDLMNSILAELSPFGYTKKSTAAAPAGDALRRYFLISKPSSQIMPGESTNDVIPFRNPDIEDSISEIIQLNQYQIPDTTLINADVYSNIIDGIHTRHMLQYEQGFETVYDVYTTDYDVYNCSPLVNYTALQAFVTNSQYYSLLQDNSIVNILKKFLPAAGHTDCIQKQNYHQDIYYTQDKSITHDLFDLSTQVQLFNDPLVYNQLTGTNIAQITLKLNNIHPSLPQENKTVSAFGIAQFVEGQHHLEYSVTGYDTGMQEFAHLGTFLTFKYDFINNIIYDLNNTYTPPLECPDNYETAATYCFLWHDETQNSNGSTYLNKYFYIDSTLSEDSGGYIDFYGSYEYLNPFGVVEYQECYTTTYTEGTEIDQYINGVCIDPVGGNWTYNLNTLTAQVTNRYPLDEGSPEFCAEYPDHESCVPDELYCADVTLSDLLLNPELDYCFPGSQHPEYEELRDLGDGTYYHHGDSDLGSDSYFLCTSIDDCQIYADTSVWEGSSCPSSTGIIADHLSLGNYFASYGCIYTVDASNGSTYMVDYCDVYDCSTTGSNDGNDDPTGGGSGGGTGTGGGGDIGGGDSGGGPVGGGDTGGGSTGGGDTGGGDTGGGDTGGGDTGGGSTGGGSTGGGSTGGGSTGGTDPVPTEYCDEYPLLCDSEGNPIDTSDPADPTDPTDPGGSTTDPTDPSDPTDPTDPGGSTTDPTDPSDPTDPTDPGGSTTDPADPSDPTDPTDPGGSTTDPTEPGEEDGDGWLEAIYRAIKDTQATIASGMNTLADKIAGVDQGVQDLNEKVESLPSDIVGALTEGFNPEDYPGTGEMVGINEGEVLNEIAAAGSELQEAADGFGEGIMTKEEYQGYLEDQLAEQETQADELMNTIEDKFSFLQPTTFIPDLPSSTGCGGAQTFNFGFVSLSIPCEAFDKTRVLLSWILSVLTIIRLNLIIFGLTKHGVMSS